MPKTVASVDISVLDFSVLLDMSAAIPTLKISNLSTMTNPTSLSWAFVVSSPFGTPIHAGVITAPDILAPTAFGTYTIAEPIPLIFGQLEFNASSAYSVKVIVKDAAGKIFDLTKSQAICKPNGNNGKNNFGAAIIEMESKCSRAQLYVVDKTNLLYKGIVGSKVSTEASVSYPKDESGFAPATVTVTSLPALLPMRSEGEGHNLYVAHKYDYNLGDNFVVRVRYSFKDTFAVWCSVNLCQLFCEVDKLTEAIQINCDIESKKEQNQKLQIINAKMVKAVVGTLQPLCGFDVPSIIEEIKKLGGFTCDCCSVRGISDVSNVLLANANLSVNKVCGDMLLSWSVDGLGNIVLNYQNASYVFAMSEDVKSSVALTSKLTTVGCVKTTTFHLDKSVLAIEIVNEIKNSQTLIGILQSLLNAGGSLVCSGLNGYNIHTTGNYFVNLSTLDLTISQILITGISYPAPANLLLTNAAGVTAWLNGLGKGTFVVNYDAPNNLTSISSTANINTVTSVGVGGNKTFLFTNSGGLICNILQSILTYLNNINLLQVKTGGNITICKVEAGEVVQTVYGPNTTAFELVTKLAEAVCANIALIAPPGGFAVTGNTRSSGFGKMQYFATLALANASAAAGETVLIYNDTAEDLTLKNNVNYQGIGTHSIGGINTQNSALSKNSLSNLIIQNIVLDGLFNIEANNVTILGNATFVGNVVWKGGRFTGANDKVITISNTSNVSNILSTVTVLVIDSASITHSLIIDSSPYLNGKYAVTVNNTTGAANTQSVCSNNYIFSVNNMGLYVITRNSQGVSIVTNNTIKAGIRTGLLIHDGGVSETTSNNISYNNVSNIGPSPAISIYNVSLVNNTIYNNRTHITNNSGFSIDGPGIYSILSSIKSCHGYSVNSYGISIDSQENNSFLVNIIDCTGTSKKLNGLYSPRDVYIIGGTYTSELNTVNGNPIVISKLRQNDALAHNYYIAGVKTIAKSLLAYAINGEATIAPISVKIMGCIFLNELVSGAVLGVDTTNINLMPVTIDAYGNMR